MDQPQQFTQVNLNIDSTSVQLFTEITKWSRFLAISGYIALAFLLIIGLISGFVIADKFQVETGLFIIIFYGIFVAIYIFPVYYLHQFSKNMGEALDNNNSAKLTQSLVFLKKHYKFLGILTIILLSLYVLVMLSTILTGIATNL